MSPTPPRPKPGTRVYHRNRGEYGVVTDQATRAGTTVHVAFIGEDDDPVEVAADALDIVPRPHGRQHWQAQYQADAQTRQRKAEDRVLAAAARPGATDYVREVAASIRDHREMAARRAVRAAADRLGIPAPPPAADTTLEYVGMSRTDLYRLQARYLNHLADQHDAGELDRHDCQYLLGVHNTPLGLLAEVGTLDQSGQPRGLVTDTESGAAQPVARRGFARPPQPGQPAPPRTAEPPAAGAQPATRRTRPNRTR